MVIPALNEEEALPGVLADIPDRLHEVIVVDNGSTDATARVAREAGATVVREEERGYGAACLRGLAELEGRVRRPDIVVFIDADHSDDPSVMHRLIEPIEQDLADLVLGVRRGPEGEVGTVMPHARFGNWLVLGLVRALFGQEYADLPPYRAIRFSSLRRLEMDDRNWGWTLQMQIRAPRRGLRVMEVVVPHRRRTEGRSKITGSLTASLRVGLKMFYTLGRERLEPR